ncbi:MAG: DinB family protein [Chloroflexota bacterium]
MVSKQYFQSVFGYHFWANGQILKKSAQLSEQDFVEDFGVGRGSLQLTIFHMLRTEDIWFQLMNEGQLLQPPLESSDFLTLETIRNQWDEVEKNYLKYLDQSTESDFEEIVQVIDQNGVKTPIQRWRMLQHVLYHGAQHRAEAAMVLTHLGHSPGDLDFIFY